ncbi:hypothetical protein ERJ75_000252700 [Trypanosoma vivax]|nr:hypothetical protein TRVL_05045 [Trypanosoma vivax]KAH8618629.1 hypothetical protein ERJ75_000252700 [Trypanosoma vivax]
MPSPSSVTNARGFLGGLSDGAMREDHLLEKVAANESGLRALAADGDWSGVGRLAERLIAGLTDDSPANLATKLRYTLVQVTAFIHLRRYSAAKEVVDALGDLKGDCYVDPMNGESLVPFSIFFIRALLPSYLGAEAVSQQCLYALLEECRERAKAALTSVWSARVDRVLRALVVSHYRCEQYGRAIRMLGELVASAWGNEAGKFSEFTALRHLLCLQQFATLCLQSGNILLARNALRAVESFKVSGCSVSVQKFHEYLIALNKGIWLAFNDHSEDATHVFGEVARGAREHFYQLNSTPGVAANTVTDPQTFPDAPECGGGRDAQMCGRLCRLALMQLHVDAATSHVTCMPYRVSEGKMGNVAVGSVIELAETYLRQEPVALLSSDTFLANSVRLYTLESVAQQEKLCTLADLLEVFRCDRQSAPNVDEIV